MTCVVEKQGEYRFVLIGLLALAVVAAFAYGPGLGLPFYSDDMYHFRWVETHDADAVLLPSDSFTSYRPLIFFLWYLWRHWIGFYDPVQLYAVSLIVHTLNGWMVFALARRLSAGLLSDQREWFSWAAGLVFILYPFSYQAVLWVGSFTHVMGAFLLLSTVLFYDRGRCGSRGWMLASLVAGFLAPFANEAGLLVAGLVMLYEWVISRATTRVIVRMTVRTVPVYLPGTLVYLAIWLGLHSVASSGVMANLQAEQLFQKAIFLAQGVTFPFQFVTARLADSWGWSVGRAVGWGVILSLVVLGLGCARSGRRRLGLACGWVALTALPPLVALSAAYVDTAPRLLYIPSVGVACLWGGALAGLLPSRRRGFYTAQDGRAMESAATSSCTKVLRAVALALILLPSLVFLRQRTAIFDLVARPARQALEASQSSPDATLLFVNLPAWAAYKEHTFPVSTEGVAFLPDYVGMADFIWANTGFETSAQAVTFANIQQDRPYWYGPWGEARDWESLDRAIRAAERVYVTLYGEEEIRLVEAGSVGGVAPDSRPLARFEGGLNLLTAQSALEPDGLTAVLVWSVDEHPDIGDAVFAQLFDGQGQLVGQADGVPLANMFPFWLCQAGDVVRDARWFPAPGGLPPGEYVLRVGLYDTGSGARRAVWDEAGARFPDDVVTVLRINVGR